MSCPDVPQLRSHAEAPAVRRTSRATSLPASAAGSSSTSPAARSWLSAARSRPIRRANLLERVLAAVDKEDGPRDPRRPRPRRVARVPGSPAPPCSPPWLSFLPSVRARAKRRRPSRNRRLPRRRSRGRPSRASLPFFRRRRLRLRWIRIPSPRGVEGRRRGPTTPVEPTPPGSAAAGDPRGPASAHGDNTAALAHARSGKLTVSGRTLAPGEALPENTTIRLPPRRRSTATAPRSSPSPRAPASPCAPGNTARRSSPSSAARSSPGPSARSRTPSPRPTAARRLQARPSSSRSSRGRRTSSPSRAPVRLAVERSDATVVRAGFEADAVRGKPAALARPYAPAKSALGWIPESLRPKKLPVIELVRSFTFDEGLEGWGRG